MPRPSRWSTVLIAAAEEFRERGYDGASLETISARAGIKKGSLYHYVDSKQELLMAVTAEPAAKFFRKIEELEKENVPPLDRLRALFRIQLEIYAEYYPAAFVFMQERSRQPKDNGLRGRDKAYGEVIETILKDGVNSGEIRLLGSMRFARRFVIGVMNSVQDWFVPREGAAPEDYHKMADELFLYAVGGIATDRERERLHMAISVAEPAE